MKPNYILRSMHGLGDNIMIRPFVRALVERDEYNVFLSTPWPELFDDLNVRFIPTSSNLRTQAKNIHRPKQIEFHQPPAIYAKDHKLGYSHHNIAATGSIIRAIEQQLPLAAGQVLKFDLPAAMAARIRHNTAVVRPVVLRREWFNVARNPKPEYVSQIASRLMDMHDVVLVGDLQLNEEWIDGPEPPHHRKYLRGELNVEQLLRLVAEASIVVGGVGWIVPAAIATGTPAFIIVGGQGRHNAPSVITDDRQDLSKIGFAVPDQLCHCSFMRHNCNKTISNLEEQWNKFASSLTKQS